MRNFFYFFLRLFKGTAEYTMMRGIQNCIWWSQKCLEWKPSVLYHYFLFAVSCVVRFCLCRLCCTLHILHTLQQDITNIFSNLVAFILIHVRRRNCATSRSINRHNVYKHKATSRVVWTIAACKINKEKKEKKRKQSRTKKKYFSNVGGVSRCGHGRAEKYTEGTSTVHGRRRKQQRSKK